MNRLFGIVITIIWVLTMLALFKKDVLPFWQADDPPAATTPTGQYQVAIHNASDQHIGTTWVTFTAVHKSHHVGSLTVLNPAAFAVGLQMIPELTLETNLDYNETNSLETFTFRVSGAGIPIHIRGERYARDFAVSAQIGGVERSFALDGAMSAYLGDTLRPFTHLKGLHVGQSWRIRLLDPFALLQGGSPQFNTQLVMVTARETIQHSGQDVSCFRVETDGTIAWADDDGRVLRQELRLPLLGKWVLTDEAFDYRRYNAARQSTQAIRQGESGESNSEQPQSKAEPRKSPVVSFGKMTAPLRRPHSAASQNTPKSEAF